MPSIRLALIGVLATLGSLTVVVARRDQGPPYEPADARATLVLEAGYRADLVASEPDIQSPVAMDIDEDGRLFVLEMPGYPLDTHPTGRVKVLEDKDGDGRYETSHVFADNLVLPTGIMRWKKGVLVTSAPDVLYLEDTDNDGRADQRHTVITGFAVTNPQHMVNGPTYGLDNWIYLAHEGPAEAVIYKDLFGDHGSPLRWPEHPDRPAVPQHRSGVRLRPDTGGLELLAGDSQYGHGFDAWGHYFTNDNSNHARHEVIAARYLARNPDLLVESAMADIPDHGEAARVFPITHRPAFELLTEAGQFTSACAITPYTGGAFPETGGTSLFVAEPVHNLVHRDVLVPNGPTFVARRAEESREFLASTDSWFRPVFLYIGPDGALYVVDFYRARIEHPEWTSSDLQKNPAPMYEGQNRGRIYRIHREGTEPAAPPSLGRADTAALVSALENDSLWWRRTAQRLLLDRHSQDAVPLLTKLASSKSPYGRLHALWTLDGLGALDDGLVSAALVDPVPGIRENAIRLAEPRLNASPALASALLGMTGENDPRVRFSVLAALGFLDSPQAAEARDRLLLQGIEDPWIRIAALSAGSDRTLALFERMTADTTTPSSPGRQSVIEQAASVVAARQRPAEVRALVERAASAPADTWWRGPAVAGLARGARGHVGTRELLGPARASLVALFGDASSEVRRGALDLLQMAGPGADTAWRTALTEALARAGRRTEDAGRRADAVTFVALDKPERRVQWFEGLIAPQEPEAVQIAAMQALRTIDRDRLMKYASSLPEADPARAPSSSIAIARVLLDRWPSLTPEVRTHAADVLIDAPERAKLLVAAMRTGVVQPWSLGFWQKQDLVLYRDADIRTSARALLEQDPQQRGATIKRYAAALDLSGDATKGEQVFTRVCAACHALDGHGADLGPDLATVRHRPPLSLLSDILLPSQSIAQGYQTYVIERIGGKTETGVLGPQTPTTITLRQGQGRQVTIRRSEIRKMTVAPQSTMPSDLDKVITPEDMADLLAYLRGASLSH